MSQTIRYRYHLCFAATLRIQFLFTTYTSPLPNDMHIPIGNLHGHHTKHQQRLFRDLIRTKRSAPPIWEDSHQSVGATFWFSRPRPLRKRVQALRTLWDLRWHGENKAVAAHSLDPQVSACPICRRHCTQAHVLCDCPSTAGARMEGSFDLNLIVSRLPPGPTMELGRKFQLLLSTFNQPTLMARRWAGQWDQAAIHSLQPVFFF